MAIMKVATYEGTDFYDKICKYSSDWIRVHGFRLEVKKYTLTKMIEEDKVILTVSHSSPPPELKAPYNCIFHSWSTSPLTAKEVLDEFIQKTDFEVKSAPPELERKFDELERVMDIRAGKLPYLLD